MDEAKQRETIGDKLRGCKRQRRSRAESEKLVKEYKESGLTAGQYAAKAGVHIGTLRRWFTPQKGQRVKHCAENLAQGIETLAVIPFWEEIERFNVRAREALRRVGVLGHGELNRETAKPFGWTEEQKAHWSQYNAATVCCSSVTHDLSSVVRLLK